MRDQRGQPVVVAEPDLVRGHRVVLVDDGQDPEFEQPAQGALGVAVVRAAHQVIGAQQHLAGADPVPGERGGVPGDQQALSHARGGLLGGQVTGPARQPQRGQPGRDGPRRDQDDLAAAAGPGGERVGQGRDPVLVDPAPRGGQRRRAHLDHERAGGRDPRPLRPAPPALASPAATGPPRDRADFPQPGRSSPPRRPSSHTHHRNLTSPARRRARLRDQTIGVAIATPIVDHERLTLRDASQSLLPLQPPQLIGGDPAVGATGAQALAIARRDLGLPVEHHGVVPVADHHLGAVLGARLGQGLFHAELGQPVGEIADGLVVGEVGLLHPAPRLVAADQERVLPGLLDLELRASGGPRPDHPPGRFLGRGRRADLGHHRGQRERQLSNAFSGGRRHLADGQPASGQHRLDLLGDFPRGGHIDLVQHHDPGPVPQIRAGDVLVGVEFGLDHVEVGDRVPAGVPAGLRGRAVQHVHQHQAALHVPEEVQAQALALAGPGDKPGHVRRHELDVARLHHAQVRGQRGERVVTDLGLGRGQRADQ